MAGPLAIAHTEASLGWGGQEIRTLTEAKGFIARGHRVVIYAAPGARILDEAPRFGVPALAMPIGEKQPKGVAALLGAFRANPVDIVNGHSSTDTTSYFSFFFAYSVTATELSLTLSVADLTRWFGRSSETSVL